MQLKYRYYQRAGGIYYWQENGTARRGSLRTKDRAEAETLVQAKNEAHRQPNLNLALGRAYLSAHDPRLCTRTWQAVMDEMAQHGIPSTQKRCSRAMRSKAYDAIRNKPLVETTAEDFLIICRARGNSVIHYLRRVHNLALNIGWLAWPVLHKKAWPKIRSQGKRAIREQEHAAIVADEPDPERRAYYEFLYETGAAQIDAANMKAEDIDWRTGVLAYRRQKLGPLSEPARLTIGDRLRAILLSLPARGDLFPNMKLRGTNARSTDFTRRCRSAGVSGVSLHSYRHSWAQRAKACGYPQRFAQEALGHSSRAVHEAYAKGAHVVCPSLDEYENSAKRKVVTGQFNASTTDSMSA